MSNLLQLVQRVKREGGVPGAVPATTINQVEEIARIVGWVNSAWLDIQSLHTEWEWMRTAFSFDTVAIQGSYTPVQATAVLAATPTVSNLGNWKRDSLRKYLKVNGVSGEMILPFLDYNTFRDMYLFGNMRTNYAPPAVYTVDPQKNLILGNAPDAVYTINGEYYSLPTTLALDADTPGMPSQFHDAIAWKALAHYGMFEVASECVTRGEREYGKFLNRLQADQLPTLTWGAPLA